MSGLTISEIREALANQIKNNIDRGVTVRPYRHGDYTTPAITVDYAPDLVSYWVTFGDTGIASLRFVLIVEPGDSLTRDSVQIRLDDFLSAGTGNNSSIIDALMVDQTLGLSGCLVEGIDVAVDPDTVTAEMTVTIGMQKF